MKYILIISGLNAEYFIGGTPIADDEAKVHNCHIVVGAPGRIKHLIELKILDVSNIKLFVLDEADKLMEKGFQQTINWIYNKLPKRKQVIAASATYPDNLDQFLANYMLSPTHVSPNIKMPVLLGIRQFYTTVPSHLNTIQQMKFKTDKLINILSNLSFNQCLVFSNYQTRAESLSNNLVQEGWPSTYISGNQDQTTRLQTVEDLRQFKCRILSSTDLTARGIDAANVDLVINYDIPRDVETYLHRMGRAGRYGSYGLCITIATEGKDVQNFKAIIKRLGNNVTVAKLPETKLFKNIWNCDLNNLEQLDAFDEIEIENENSREMDVTNSVESTTINENSYESNEDIANKSLTHVADLLSNPYNATINVIDIEYISNLLNHIKNKWTYSSPVIKTLYTHKGNSTILKEMSDGILQKDSLSIQSKKTKLEDADILCENQDSKVFNKEATNFQNNMQLRKNIALFAISKLIMENKNSDLFIKDCSKEIANILEILKEEDRAQLLSYSSEDIRKFLQQHNITEQEINTASSSKNNPEKSNNINCFCSDNLFSTAYEYSLKSDKSINWRHSVCSKHSEQTDKDTEESDIPLDLYEEDNSAMNLPEIYSSSDEEKNINENIFTDAYDQAIHGKFEKTVESQNEASTTEPFGFTAENSYSKKFFNFTLPSSENHNQSVSQITDVSNRIMNSSYVSPELKNFIERRNVYSSYYQHYSNVLSETAPNFTNTNDFRTWFRQWKEEVEAVRDYVQQDIFKNECQEHRFQ